ncbi:MAG: lytic transglycosylase domain-containing protein [Alphaproteobacteria bacterium]|nr:lytic transglycosylase domain-containing protein [Alphaproteobacteria bacterium]MCB9928143.1 lytic transglycosylase domain-containing protein [Alphaproteobacteria bacterium]
MLLLAAAQAAPRAAPTVCASAAATAARESGVPEEWLQAIALVESGRVQRQGRTAWPWAVNDHGEGLWFANKREAVRHVQRQLAAGRTSVDVGCFQINWRWHGEAFDGVADAFDPLANARYAARFLRQLRDETGSWPEAVGRYHSATPHLNRAYRARVARAREVVETGPRPVRRALPPAAGGVVLAMLHAAEPLLRAPARPLLVRAEPGMGGHGQ